MTRHKVQLMKSLKELEFKLLYVKDFTKIIIKRSQRVGRRIQRLGKPNQEYINI